MKMYRTLRTLSQKKTLGTVNVGIIHESLEAIHEEVSTRNGQAYSCAQQIHYAQTKAWPRNIVVGDFVMFRVSAKRGHKLQRTWKGQMPIIEPLSHLLFVVKDINCSHKIAAHAKRLIPYPVSSNHQQASKDLQQQAIYYDTMTQIVE